MRRRLEESDLVHIRKGGIQRRCREEQFCYTEECMLSKDVITRLANARDGGWRLEGNAEHKEWCIWADTEIAYCESAENTLTLPFRHPSFSETPIYVITT